jgi:AcrR family transcriptional regulator
MAKRRARPAGRRAARVDTTEQRILDAAHAVFLRRGTAGARMHQIARQAGVNQALVHYYFRSKDRLAEAVFRRAALELLPAVIGVMASALAIEEKVERVVGLELDYLQRRPYLPAYVLSELNQHPERGRQLVAALTGMAPEDVRRKVLGTLEGQITARVGCGTMRSIEPEQFFVNLIALCIFPFAARPLLMAVFGLDERGFARFIDRRRRELAAFFLRGLRP